ncbi:hypothetical protein L0F63_002911 [Massospora cicadina]|nr:hypothetical protein L0F63_002911 [Massospora cicadina]
MDSDLFQDAASSNSERGEGESLSQLAQIIASFNAAHAHVKYLPSFKLRFDTPPPLPKFSNPPKPVIGTTSYAVHAYLCDLYPCRFGIASCVVHTYFGKPYLCKIGTASYAVKAYLGKPYICKIGTTSYAVHVYLCDLYPCRFGIASCVVHTYFGKPYLCKIGTTSYAVHAYLCDLHDAFFKAGGRSRILERLRLLQCRDSKRNYRALDRSSNRKTKFESSCNKRQKIAYGNTDDPENSLSEFSSDDETSLLVKILPPAPALAPLTTNPAASAHSSTDSFNSVTYEKRALSSFELEEAMLVKELDQRYVNMKQNPAPPVEPKPIIAYEKPRPSCRNLELLAKVRKVRDSLASFTELSLYETLDRKITGTASFYSVRVVSKPVVHMHMVTVHCKVTHEPHKTRKVFVNDEDLFLKLGEDVLINFLVSLPLEKVNYRVHSKRERIQPGAIIDIHRPAMKLAVFEPRPAAKSGPINFRAAILSYRFCIR